MNKREEKNMPLQLEKPDNMPVSQLTIKAYKNYLKKVDSTDSSFGKVQAPSTRINISNLSALIADRHSGVEPAMISFVARLLHEETMRQLNEGKSVEVLGLGTVYITTKGSMKGLKPSIADVPKMVLKFRPSKEAKAKIKNIDGCLIVPITIVPVINIVEDMKTKDTTGNIKKGSVIKITGKRLRVEGNDSSVGLFFVKDSGTRINVDKSLIIRNEPATLEVILPSDLEVGTYTIEVVNQGRFKDEFSRTIRKGVSEFTVKVED